MRYRLGQTGRSYFDLSEAEAMTWPHKNYLTPATILVHQASYPAKKRSLNGKESTGTSASGDAGTNSIDQPVPPFDLIY